MQSHFIWPKTCPINVTNEGLKFLVNTLDKWYVIPLHNYFSMVALPVMYRKRRGEIESDLANVKYFATTTDLWSSRTMDPYMSLTVHYINENFAMQLMLAKVFFPRKITQESQSPRAWGRRWPLGACRRRSLSALQQTTELMWWRQLL